MLKKIALMFVCVGLISCGSDAPSSNSPLPVTGISDPAEIVADKALQLASTGDHSKAAELFLQAAEQGNRPAQYFIGLYYARGEGGVAQDFGKSFEWLEKASMGGHPKAMYHLGEMYVHGDGVAVDHVKAMAWFWVATTLGERYAEKRLRAVSPRLTTDEIGDAKLLSQELYSKIPHDMKIERIQLH
ncbi:Sel1 repeat-containing protein [Mariprofundus aestuarium]|uniref:Sel1 repeat-containing protein n=1 Tax=Mariprofundus aestuarium TaxID=1921086 RepID=A0A2K8KYN6_MARES|nr:tetratricopeptide repeat protein [Mariprofundus aestuarium]ATX80095.1 Sel1 repeat-containing protein [Mariprofundus aestuarium]